MLRALAVLLIALAGCGNDVVDLRVVSGHIDRSCPHDGSSDVPIEAWRIRSIRVEVIEWYSGSPGEPLVSECSEDIEGLAIRHPQQLIDWFDERGYVARDIPAEVPTRLQIIGFSNADCTIEFRPVVGPLLCGLSEGVLSESTYGEGDPVRLTFACPAPANPESTGAYGVCLRVGTLPE